MRTRTLTIVIFLLMAVLAVAQNPFLGGGSGGGQDGPSEAWKEFKLNPKTTLKLDFRNANIDMVLSLYSKSSGINIVKDPNLTGPITVTSAGPVSLNTAFEILNATLSMKGYEMRKEGGLLLIRQRSQRGNSNSFPAGMDLSALTEQVRSSRGELKVYPLKFASATQIARVINEVFAMATDPTMDILNMLMGGGTIPGVPTMNLGGGNQGGGGGRGNQGGGRGNNQGGNNNRFQTRQGGFGGFGGFGNRQASTVRASADDFSNSVIINAPRNEHQQVETLIKQIDKESDAPLQPKVYKLQYAWCDDMAPSIQNVLMANAPTGRGGNAQQNVPFEQRIQQAFRFGNTRTAFGQVVTDPRTNALIVSATDDNHKVVEQVIKELDTEVHLEQNAFVVPLNNARADDVATLLSQAFGQRDTNGNRNNRQVGGRTNTNTQPQRNNNTGGTQPRTGGGGGGGGGGGFGGESTNDPTSLQLDFEDPEAAYGELMTSIGVVQGFGIQIGGQQQNRQSQSGTQGRDAQGRIVNTRDLTNQVTVIPDQNTNSLIVVTSPDNIDLIRSILEQLDRIPEQVMIETVIIEATLDNSSKFGLEWKYASSNPIGNTGATGTSEGAFGLQNATPPLQGFRYTLAGGPLTGFFNALQKDEKFQVLSTPRIFTSNNAQAEINISQRVPYVLSTREDTNGNLTFTYAFQDVGIVLTVTPRITANGYVTMDIVQTANDLQGFTDFNAPIINQRSADTTVSVKDGETIILGGIIRNTVTSSVKKIPLLGDIPLLGNLFRSTEKSKVRTELMVFLTPKIVRGPEDAQKLKKEQEDKLSNASKEALNQLKPPTTTTKPPATGGGTGGGGGK